MQYILWKKNVAKKQLHFHYIKSRKAVYIKFKNLQEIWILHNNIGMFALSTWPYYNIIRPT